MVDGAAHDIVQVLTRVEPTFCNLGNSVNGVPGPVGLWTPGSSPAAGLACASPEFKAVFETAVNEETRARADYTHAPVLLTQRTQVDLGLYMRGAGSAAAFTDPTFSVLDACFGISETHAVQHDVLLFPTTTTLEIANAYADGLRPGQGFAIILPTGKHFGAFVVSISQGTGTAGADVVTYAQPMKSAERVACAAAAAGSVKLRGGRTYAIGAGYREGTSLYMMLQRLAYAEEAYGLRGAQINCALNTGEAATLQTTLQGVYAHQGGYAPTIGGGASGLISWNSANQATFHADAAALLIVGMYAKVVTATAVAGTYLVRVRAINGAVVDFEPTGLPALITAEAPVPGLTAIRPGATSTPAGKRLTFLNGRLTYGGVATAVRSVTWDLNLNPAVEPDPDNAAGAIGMAMGTPTVGVEVVFTRYDNGAAFQALKTSADTSLLCMLADGTSGNMAMLYAPVLHHSKAAEPTGVDGLTALKANLEMGLCTTDQTAYDGVAVSNTGFRLFVSF